MSDQNVGDKISKDVSEIASATTVSDDLTANSIIEENKKTIDIPCQLSKSQLKKLAKKRKWEEGKALRRAKTKVKKKEFKEKLKTGVISPPDDFLSRKQKKSNLMKDSTCKVAVAIDMSFDHLMIEKDMAKCIKQIHRSYSINRKQKQPVQFYVTSFGATAEEAIKKHSGWDNWDVNFTNKSFMNIEKFPKEKLVYLTSESENVLSELHPEYLYVIGGLVDHNGHKGLCHSRANQNGINHARLPISEYIDMKTRKVLTIVHVFEILVLVAQGTHWETSLINVIAPRKQAQLKICDTS